MDALVSMALLLNISDSPCMDSSRGPAAEAQSLGTTIGALLIGTFFGLMYATVHLCTRRMNSGLTVGQAVRNCGAPSLAILRLHDSYEAIVGLGEYFCCIQVK